MNAEIGMLLVDPDSQPQLPLILSARILLEEVIRIPVDLIPTDESQQWDQLATGELHVVFELW